MPNKIICPFCGEERQTHTVHKEEMYDPCSGRGGGGYDEIVDPGCSCEHASIEIPTIHAMCVNCKHFQRSYSEDSSENVVGYCKSKKYAKNISDRLSFVEVDISIIRLKDYTKRCAFYEFDFDLLKTLFRRRVTDAVKDFDRI